jgi:hypothetical protein
MASFVTFDFTCGNFTSGNGYYIGSYLRPDSSIIEQRLIEAGEKNCKVIMTQFKSNPTEHNRYEEFQYNATSRWYTTLFSGVATVATVVVPVMLTSLPSKNSQ